MTPALPRNDQLKCLVPVEELPLEGLERQQHEAAVRLLLGLRSVASTSQWGLPELASAMVRGSRRVWRRPAPWLHRSWR